MKNILFIFIMLNSLVLGQVTSVIEKMENKTIVLKVYQNNQLIGININSYDKNKNSKITKNIVSKIFKEQKTLSCYEVYPNKLSEIIILMDLDFQTKKKILEDSINKSEIIQNESILKDLEIKNIHMKDLCDEERA